VNGGGEDRSPRERFLTVFGRLPVLEALADPSLTVAQVFIADDVATPAARSVAEVAGARGVAVHRVGRAKVTRVSGTGRQHQGFAADVVAPNQSSLPDWLRGLPATGATCLLLDGITTPANVGMIIRTATAAGLAGIVVPTHGVADIGPLVIKASAGVAFRAPLVRIRTAYEAAQQLRDAGFHVVSLDAEGTVDLWEMELADRTALVLGGEHAGVSEDVAALVTQSVRIPMSDGVESLNVAAAAAVLCFEVLRRAQPAG
jgi:23S rRNA (guanosine2251-2'-O)-methyltransferase